MGPLDQLAGIGPVLWSRYSRVAAMVSGRYSALSAAFLHWTISAQRIRRAVALGASLILGTLVGGSALLLERTRQTALHAVDTTLQNAALVVENTINRQLLQVDGALASLPALFAAVASKTGDIDQQSAALLLRAFNFETFAFRDLLLLRPDGTLWAAARPRPKNQPPRLVALPETTPHPGAVAVLGPIRNALTGDWAWLLARPITLPDVGTLQAVAEVPVSFITTLLAPVGKIPGVHIYIERPDGLLFASLPHNELMIGKRVVPAIDKLHADNLPILVPSKIMHDTTAAILRHTLYPDVQVTLTLDLSTAMADWSRDRDRLLIVVAVAGLFVLALAVALYTAMREHERVESERMKSRDTLDSAIESMADGFVMWDEQDRLITCNARYRDMYAISAPFFKPGARFEDIMMAGAELGQCPQAGDDIDRFVQETIDWHRGNYGSIERLLPFVTIDDDRIALAVYQCPLSDGGWVATYQDVTEQQRAEGRIRFMAHHDILTQLPNRVLFHNNMDVVLSHLNNDGRRLALLYLDLDRFKYVNDTLGHPAGDALLEAAARRLQSCVRGSDIVSRLGGDEFAILYLAADLPAAATTLAQRLIDALSAPYQLGQRRVEVGVSIGIAIATGADMDGDTLLKNADMALYQAKAQGRGTYCVFEADMEARLHARLTSELDLRVALERGQFEIYYQPILDLHTDQLCGFEALLRWNHPTRGVVMPGQFIPLAEELGIIKSIGAWLFRQACSDAVRFLGEVKVAVNLSPIQLEDDGIIEIVSSALSEPGLDPARLEIEITESALLKNSAMTIALLVRLHSLGLSIALDDFGTGYSSLSYLRSFPFDKIKIDRLFISEMATRDDCAAIVSSVVSLAARLGMATTAEGVETNEQLELVRKVGCSSAQGYLLGRPEPIRQSSKQFQFNG
jgi:diguanylate cyclase (GGDEF)-like protein